jgi:hypothetical protein
MEMTERRLKVLARQKRIQEERAEERKPILIRRCRSCNAKLREANDTEWCAPCRARAVRMGKPGRAPSD